MSNPWEVEGVPWKTEAAYWSWVRGVIRKGWSIHPVKLEFIKAQRKQIPNPNPAGKKATVWGMTCDDCGEDYPCSIPTKTKKSVKAKYGVDLISMEIDHIGQSASLQKKEDLGDFVNKLLYVTFEDLRPLCKPCHDIRSYQAKWGITFEEAVTEKEVIAFGKLSVKEQKSKLTEVYVSVDDSNEKLRKKAYREYLKGED